MGSRISIGVRMAGTSLEASGGGPPPGAMGISAQYRDPPGIQPASPSAAPCPSAARAVRSAHHAIRSAIRFSNPNAPGS